ncbi:DUF2093 domain-containing protein [Zavarzinia sp.]|uniref:DUF2093 domain-containing protein n=1 Tax=Zavarzinia sp. TaxID=2027920 RepID=UPI003568157E
MMDASAPAKLHFEHGHFRILWPGAFVICAATGAQIQLEDLRYWSVDRQEAYASPEAALMRAAQLGLTP